MEWNGLNKRKLRKALITIYNSSIKLDKFVSDELDRVLSEISTESSLDDRAFELLEEAVSGGWLDDLYQKFCTVNQSNCQIVKLHEDLKDTATFIGEEAKALVSPERVIGEPDSSNAVIRMEEGEGLVEDPNSVHLVVAVFWEKPSEQKVRIQPKLCYRKDNPREISQKPLMKDSCSIQIKEFPKFLEELVKVTAIELSRLFADPIHPWKLTIELFVPVDLLCFPLSKWCGQDSELLKTHPIVIGCSDRFDPSQMGGSANLHNQLKRGWQRFQNKVSDQAGSVLRNLDWLSSDLARQSTFEAYSGFQCYGDWLKADEASLSNWQELVRSGIPVALWMCEGSPQRQDITSVFNHLIDCTRFEFLDRIPIKRSELQRTCNHCIGVFYEDPNYVPDIPLAKEEQFFSWPGA